MQVSAPPMLYVPALQSEQDVAAFPEYFPMPQREQVERPSTFEYVPPGQSWHPSVWASLYFPVLQAVQEADPSADHVPDPHGKQAAASAEEYEPATQFEQVSVTPSEYVPAPHAEQEEALAPEYRPAEQGVHSVLAASE